MALLIASSVAHSSAYDLALQNSPGGSPAGPLDPWAYDQVVAHPPLKQAPIASVALAQVNIALHMAKKNAEQALCNGLWTPLGHLAQPSRTGDKTLHTTNKPHSKNWHFNMLRYPHELSCGEVSRAMFFKEMSRHLPGWIRIRPAGQLTAFKQGETVLLNEISLALAGTPKAY